MHPCTERFKVSTAIAALAIAILTAVSATNSHAGPPNKTVDRTAPMFIPHFEVLNNQPAPTGGEAHFNGQTIHGDVHQNGTIHGGYDNKGRGGSIEHGPGNTGGELHWKWSFN